MWQFFKGIKFKQIVVIALALIMFVLAIFISPNYINPEYNDNFGYYNQPDGSVRIFEYLKDYSENEKEILIPETIDGKKVGSIAKKSIGYSDGVQHSYIVIRGVFDSPAYEYAINEGFKFICTHHFQSTTLREATYHKRALEHLVCPCGYEEDKETEFKKIPSVRDIKAKSIGNGIEVNWQLINGINEYRVYRADFNSNNFIRVDLAVGNTYTDYSVENGDYHYRVTGVSGDNEGEDYGTIAYCSYLKSPDFLLSSERTGVLIRWDYCKDALKYRIYKRNSSGEYTLIHETKDANELNFIDANVKRKTEYFYSVTAVYEKHKQQESEKTLSGNSIVYGKGLKVVYLTFDDGPSKNTLKILKILKKYDAKATFFVTGLGESEYMRKIVEKGHTIALHTYSHDYKKIYSSSSNYYDDLFKISNLVYTKTGVDSKIIRFPGGSSNTVSRSYSRGIMSRLTKSVENNGYRYFDWNVNSGDADGVNVSARRILQNVKAESKGKDKCVVLMHDTLAKNTTVKALSSICAFYKKNGYEFAALTMDSLDCKQTVNN